MGNQNTGVCFVNTPYYLYGMCSEQTAIGVKTGKKRERGEKLTYLGKNINVFN